MPYRSAAQKSRPAIFSMISSSLNPSLEPSIKADIGKAVFGASFRSADDPRFRDCFEYYEEEIRLLRFGISSQTWQCAHIAVTEHSHVLKILHMLRDSRDLTKMEIRNRLSQLLPAADSASVNRAIDLGVRLSLMLNAQEQAFESLRSQTRCITWQDEATIEGCIQSVFPRSRSTISHRESRLSPYFTIANRVHICGLEIQWTTSLHEHLRLDRTAKRKVLRVFRYDDFLRALLTEQLIWHPIPRRVIEETLMSLDLLCPPWDTRTDAFLEKQQVSLSTSRPYVETRALDLSEFECWGDRLLEIYEEVFQSPPVSWAQLYRDRRSPQQFWAFWIALIILALTLYQCLIGTIQTWAAVQVLYTVPS